MVSVFAATSFNGVFLPMAGSSLNSNSGVSIYAARDADPPELSSKDPSAACFEQHQLD
jgi:hypothetical protein